MYLSNVQAAKTAPSWNKVHKDISESQVASNQTCLLLEVLSQVKRKKSPLAMLEAVALLLIIQ